jgi:hypothetical protein
MLCRNGHRGQAARVRNNKVPEDAVRPYRKPTNLSCISIIPPFPSQTHQAANFLHPLDALFREANNTSDLQPDNPNTASYQERHTQPTKPHHPRRQPSKPAQPLTVRQLPSRAASLHTSGRQHSRKIGADGAIRRVCSPRRGAAQRPARRHEAVPFVYLRQARLIRAATSLADGGRGGVNGMERDGWAAWCRLVG